MSTATMPGSVSAIGGWVAYIRLAFDRWAKSTAQYRADARLWAIARSDPRIMGELMQARMRIIEDAYQNRFHQPRHQHA